MYTFIGDVLKVALKFAIPNAGTPEHDALSCTTKAQHAFLRTVERKWWALPMRQLRRVDANAVAGGGGGDTDDDGDDDTDDDVSDNDEALQQAATTLRQLRAGPAQRSKTRTDDKTGPSGRARAAPDGDLGAGASTSKPTKQSRQK